MYLKIKKESTLADELNISNKNEYLRFGSKNYACFLGGLGKCLGCVPTIFYFCLPFPSLRKKKKVYKLRK